MIKIERQETWVSPITSDQDSKWILRSNCTKMLSPLCFQILNFILLVHSSILYGGYSVENKDNSLKKLKHVHISRYYIEQGEKGM